MSDDIRPLWERSDEHSKKLTELEIRTAVHQETLMTHTSQIAQIAKDSSERHGQLVAMLDAGSEKMDTIIADYNQQLGAAKYKQFVIPVLISVIAVMATLGYFSK